MSEPPNQTLQVNVMAKLNDSIEIGNVYVKNRFALPPMVSNKSTLKGEVTNYLLDHYERRAAGGTGLIIVEASAIAWEHRIGRRNIGIHDDAMIPGLKQLADVIKKHGAAAFIQINHAGAKSGVATRFVGPSNVPILKGKIPEMLTHDEMEQITHWFVEAARRAKEAGFDGVEIHGAHYYLLSTFLSSSTNKRTDQYGGGIEEKARFLVEIIQEMRKALGDYAIIVRINGIENVEDGITMEEGVEIAQILERAGVDAIHTSCVVDPAYNPDIKAIFGEGDAPKELDGFPFDCCLPSSSAMKKKVKIPVIGVGMVRDEALARRAVEEGHCDIIAVGRGMLADSEFAFKILNGRGNTIKPWRH